MLRRGEWVMLAPALDLGGTKGTGTDIEVKRLRGTGGNEGEGRAGAVRREGDDQALV
jgi:hypothetical protein